MSKAESGCDTSRYQKDGAKTCETDLERELQVCKRQLEIAEKERDELKISNADMFCQLEVAKRQMKVTEELKSKAEERVTTLCQLLEASERNLKISETEKNLLIDNIYLLKNQESLMYLTYERKELESMSTTVNVLPLELLDMILQKSYLFYVRGRHCSTQFRNQAIVEKVASVDFRWFQMVTRQRFKRAIWRHLKVFYRDISIRYIICRSNRPYLEQFLKYEDLTTRLKSVDCPTDVQARQRKLRNSWKSQNTSSTPRNMNSEETQVEDTVFELQKKNCHFDFLRSIRFLDEIGYLSMIDCFRQSNQNTARLAENGGVAVKVELLNGHLLRPFKNLPNKTRYLLAERIISQLRSIGIEILNSFGQHRHADVWIWCKSQRGLNFLHSSYESGSHNLTYLLSFVLNVHIFRSMKINIDMDQFKQEIISPSIVIKFVQELDLHEMEGDHIVGVAKLLDKILVISRSPQTVITVFKDQNPFCLQKIMALREILCPEDIASSEQQQCVYISDKDSYCIWKITSKPNDDYEVTKWCSASSPFTMSVSSSGHLVMVRNDNIRPVLEIYDSDAILLHSIDLPTGIQNPRHAVETSTGNFITLHYCTNERNKAEPCISELMRHQQKVFHRFIPKNKEQLLGVPYQLSLASDDRVLVADHWNHRLILLNSDLTWNQICPMQYKNDEKQRPKRMHYDGKSRQLIVAGNVSLLKGAVWVYVLSWK